MTTKAFVTACRGPEDTPAPIIPLSYLLTAIHTLDELNTAMAEREEDPIAFEDMICELRSLHKNLTAALADQDATAQYRRRCENDIRWLYHDSPIGDRLLAEVVAERGLSALTDQAIADLRAAHLREDAKVGI